MNADIERWKSFDIDNDDFTYRDILQSGYQHSWIRNEKPQTEKAAGLRYALAGR